MNEPRKTPRWVLWAIAVTGPLFVIAALLAPVIYHWSSVAKVLRVKGWL